MVATREVVLRVDGVEKGFSRGVPPWQRRVEVLTGAGLELRAGELVGLVGENGSTVHSARASTPPPT